MENEKLIEIIGKILKKPHREPLKFIELISCIYEFGQEGVIASCPKVVRKLWPEEWKQAEDKVQFEISKWNLLCKRRREINDRIFNSNMCFSFYIELPHEKQFRIISDPKEIYSKRIEEIEQHLVRAKSKDQKEKIKGSIIELTEKFKDIEDGKIEKLSEDQPPAIELPDKPSIAVLPFVNISGDPEQEYFSDGITDELINVLAKLEELKVISRTSAFYFKGQHVDLRTVGEKLNVETVLEGSVRKAGNQLRITAQLIKVADDTHLWAETYDRELKDVFDIQEEVSNAIVDKLRVRLVVKEDRQLVKGTTENMEAFELYLKAKSIPMTPARNDDIVELYEKVIELEPNFAPAYAELAIQLAFLPLEPKSLQDEDYLKAKEYTEKALKLDYTNARALAGLAITKRLEWDWDGAEKELKRAIELNPGSFFLHTVYAEYLMVMGRYNEGLIESMKSMELDPLAQRANAEYGIALERTGQFDQAIEQFEKTIEMFPEDPGIKLLLARAYEWNGMYDEAMEIHQELGFQRGIMVTYALKGKRVDAQKMLEEMKNEEGINPINYALFHTIFGEKDKAIEWLEQAVEEHHPQCECIIAYSDFDNLRSDPRFIALLKKMGIEG